MADFVFPTPNAAVRLQEEAGNVTRATNDIVTGAMEASEMNANLLTGRQNPSPATAPRRAFLLAGFLACLSVVVFVVNTLVTLASDIVQDEKIWEYLNEFMGSRDNITARS